MKKTSAIYFFIIFTLCTSCVNVSLGPQGEPERARGVEFQEPSKPFTKQSREDVDAAWKNEKNGNTISYLSDCKDTTDPTLEHIVTGLLSGLSSINRDHEDVVTIQGREGRRVLATGKVDGVPTQIDLLVFKRNRCIYILSYVGVKATFQADHDKFNSFVTGFRAP